jgi:hypothetical protein
MTDWISHTRLHSVRLVRNITVLCEEHLTVEAHEIFASYIKAYTLAHDQHDTVLRAGLDEVCELSGRYISADTYVPYFLPRIRGDSDLMPYGIDTRAKQNTIHVLTEILRGSKPSVVAEHFQELVDTFTDMDIIPWDSASTRRASLDALLLVLSVCRGRGRAAMEALFVRTGRLSALRQTLTRAFRKLLLESNTRDVAHLTTQGLADLGAFDSRTEAGQSLHSVYGQDVLSDTVDSFVPPALWSTDCADQTLLTLLLLSDTSCTLSQPDACLKAIQSLCGYVRACSSSESLSHEQRSSLLNTMSSLLKDWIQLTMTSELVRAEVMDVWAAQVC